MTRVIIAVALVISTIAGHGLLSLSRPASLVIMPRCGVTV